MGRDSAAYGRMLQQLLPPGLAWSRDPLFEIGLLCLALGDEFARIDARGLVLIEEAYPNTTNELLPDWERVAGLPDPAIPAPVTTADRISALIARLTENDGQAEPDYQALVASFGFSATVTHHTPFAAGVGYAGAPLYDQASIFWWEVNITVPIGTPTPLVILEHAIRRRAQVHTYPTFNYIFV